MFVVYHNPSCGTSRNVLQLIRDAGQEPVVVEYMKEGWTRAHLLGLFAAAGLSAREALRLKSWPEEELGAFDESMSEDALLDAMIAHPVLVERPFVACAKGVRLCRPKERVQELL